MDYTDFEDLNRSNNLYRSSNFKIFVNIRNLWFSKLLAARTIWNAFTNSRKFKGVNTLTHSVVGKLHLFHSISDFNGPMETSTVNYFKRFYDLEILNIERFYRFPFLVNN